MSKASEVRSRTSLYSMGGLRLIWTGWHPRNRSRMSKTSSEVHVHRFCQYVWSAWGEHCLVSTCLRILTWALMWTCLVKETMLAHRIQCVHCSHCITCRSINLLSIYLLVHLSIFKSIPFPLSIYLSIDLSIFLSTYLSIHLSFYISAFNVVREHVNIKSTTSLGTDTLPKSKIYIYICDESICFECWYLETKHV